MTYDKPAMALAALDVRSGQSRWTAPIGDVALTQKNAQPARALAPDAVVVDRVAGPVRVSRGDGAESAPDPKVVAWSRVPIEFTQKVPWRSGLAPDYFTWRGEVFEGVLNGQVTDAVSLPLPASVGARFDAGLTVLTTANVVAAYRT